RSFDLYESAEGSSEDQGRGRDEKRQCRSDTVTKTGKVVPHLVREKNREQGGRKSHSLNQDVRVMKCVANQLADSRKVHVRNVENPAKHRVWLRQVHFLTRSHYPCKRGCDYGQQQQERMTHPLFSRRP